MLNLGHCCFRVFLVTSTALLFKSWAVTSEGVVRSRGQQEYRVSGLEVVFFNILIMVKKLNF